MKIADLRFSNFPALQNELEKAYRNISTRIILHRKFPAKILLIDDEHFPFGDLETLKRIIKTECGSGKIDGIITAEILDLPTLSQFPKTYQADPVLAEQLVLEVIDYLSKYVSWGVILLGSNHLLRLRKWLERNLTPDIAEYFKYLLRGGLPRFVKELPKKWSAIESSFCQIGSAVFAHFDQYSGIPLRVPEMAYRWLENHHDIYSIKMPITSLWCGHTHALRIDYSLYKTLLAEIGCLSYLQPYTIEMGKIKHGTKFRWTQGYGVLYLDKNGDTDFSKSGIRFIKYAGLPNLKDKCGVKQEQK